MPTATASSQIVLNGQVGLLSNRDMLSGGGKYFVATNPTPGTAIAYSLKTSYSATANGLFCISNNNPQGGANIYLDHLLLVQTATAPTGTLSMRFEAFNETGIVAMTGAVSTITPVQINTGAGNSQTTGAVVQAFATGAGTVPAAVGTRRLQGIGAIPTGVAVTHDSYFVDFGTDCSLSPTAGLTAARATAPARQGCQMPPVVIAPQTTSWINMWWVTAAANTPSFEFQLGFIEL